MIWSRIEWNSLYNNTMWWQLFLLIIFTRFLAEISLFWALSFATKSIKQSKIWIFTGLITSLDSQDKSNAFTNSELPNNYVNNNEPQVQPGQNKGLYLMLDAHSDLFSASSVDSDNEGFVGLVHPKGAFPFTMLEGFTIRPG